MSDCPAGFSEVSKDTFFAAVGPMNVHPRPEKNATYWERPDRALMGVTTPGYLGGSPARYYLKNPEIKGR